MFGFGNNYSRKRIQKWSDKNEIEKIIGALEKGNDNSKLFAISQLEIHNFINVKRALFAALDDKNKDVAMRAAKVIKTMGANPDEQIKIKEVEKKWS